MAGALIENCCAVEVAENVYVCECVAVDTTEEDAKTSCTSACDAANWVAEAFLGTCCCGAEKGGKETPKLIPPWLIWREFYQLSSTMKSKRTGWCWKKLQPARNTDIQISIIISPPLVLTAAALWWTLISYQCMEWVRLMISAVTSIVLSSNFVLPLARLENRFRKSLCPIYSIYR